LAASAGSGQKPEKQIQRIMRIMRMTDLRTSDSFSLMPARRDFPSESSPKFA